MSFGFAKSGSSPNQQARDKFLVPLEILPFDEHEAVVLHAHGIRKEKGDFVLMRVSKWGNSLAIRLPAAVVATLDLREGDAVDIHVEGARSFAVEKKTRVPDPDALAHGHVNGMG